MIKIKELKTLTDLEKVSVIEENVWGMPPLPTHQTLTAVKNGGLVIGAYDDNNLIGFSYGFPGFTNGKIYLCSHMLGIEESYRSRKIGEQIKWKQREIALNKGYREMHWTFDPLETRNAYLNLSKLNGICHTYIENAYGDMKDGINKGIPSDRFEIHWHLASPHVEEKIEVDLENAVQINTTTIEQGFPKFLSSIDNQFTADVYALDVPLDFQKLKQSNQDNALDWRYKTRAIFQDLFALEYTAVNLIPGKNLATYIFVKKETIQLGGY